MSAYAEALDGATSEQRSALFQHASHGWYDMQPIFRRASHLCNCLDCAAHQVAVALRQAPHRAPARQGASLPQPPLQWGSGEAVTEDHIRDLLFKCVRITRVPQGSESWLGYMAQVLPGRTLALLANPHAKRLIPDDELADWELEPPTEHGNGGALNDEQRGGASDRDPFERIRLLIGKRAVVRRAPDDRADWCSFEVCVVAPRSYWRPSSLPDVVATIMRRHASGILGTDITEDEVREWQLDEVIMGTAMPGTQPKPSKEPMTYDHTAFAADLDAAITTLRATLRTSMALGAPQPHVPAGIKREVAMLRVVEALVLRSLSHDVWEAHLTKVLDDARVLLLHKNQAYGDSALNPVRVFSQASLTEQLLVRLDDKASRLARGHNAGEGVAADMLGYFLLILIAEERGKRSQGDP